MCAHSSVFLAGAQNKNRVGREMVSKAIGWRVRGELCTLLSPSPLSGPHPTAEKGAHFWEDTVWVHWYAGYLNNPLPHILYYCCLDAACIVLALLCIQLNHMDNLFLLSIYTGSLKNAYIHHTILKKKDQVCLISFLAALYTSSIVKLHTC